MRNFRRILDEYPGLKPRLISLRNLHRSLCLDFWPVDPDNPDEDKRPEVYEGQIDRACFHMERYRTARTLSPKDTSYLIMCGSFPMRTKEGMKIGTHLFVKQYLDHKFQELEFPPQIVVGGHPSHYLVDDDPFHHRAKTHEALATLGVLPGPKVGKKQ